MKASLALEQSSAESSKAGLEKQKAAAEAEQARLAAEQKLQLKSQTSCCKTS